MTTETITELINIIESRQSHYSELRAIAAGALPSIWSDWRHYEPAGSIAADIVSVLEASLIGRVDLRVDPDDPTADQLISLLYNKHLHPLVREAVRDYIICGWSGIAITPFGPARLKPEHAVAGQAAPTPWRLRSAPVPLLRLAQLPCVWLGCAPARAPTYEAYRCCCRGTAQLQTVRTSG